MRITSLSAALVLAGTLVVLGREDATAPSVEKPYIAALSAPVMYDINFRVVVTAPSGTKSLKVWVPVPQDDRGQTISDGEWSVFPTDLKPTFHTEMVFGNRFAYFEFSSPQGAQIIAHSFRAKVWQLDWNVEPSKVGHV